MRNPWEKWLQRWSEAGLIDAAAAEGVHAFEAARDIRQPLAFFIPEHVADPSRRQPAEELWVEVTVPRKGPPRPIRLGVKKGGVLTPLALE